METILRKIKCSERLPVETGTYFVLMNEEYKRRLYFMVQGPAWYTDAHETKHPEYWFEEIKIEQIAKENYLKALEFVLNNNIEIPVEGYVALQIAAGTK